MIFLVRMYVDRNGPATRQEILNALEANPGLTKTQLCRQLGLAWGTISHHVRVLEQEGDLVKRRLHGWSRLYIPATPSAEMALMPLLREETVPRILSMLSAKPGLNIKDLTLELSESRKVLRRCLKMMVEAGALERRGNHRPKFYVAGPGGLTAADCLLAPPVDEQLIRR